MFQPQHPIEPRLPGPATVLHDGRHQPVTPAPGGRTGDGPYSGFERNTESRRACRQHAIPRPAWFPNLTNFILSVPSLLDLGGLPLLQLGEMPPASGGPANACWIWRWVRFSPWHAALPSGLRRGSPLHRRTAAFVGEIDASAGKARSLDGCASRTVGVTIATEKLVARFLRRIAGPG